MSIGLITILTWIFRFKVVVADFIQFELSDTIFRGVLVSKMIVSLVMIFGVFSPLLSFVSTSLMLGFMAVAQSFHWKVNNPLDKKLPSLILGILCLVVLLF